jgi:hypothetical protein
MVKVTQINAFGEDDPVEEKDEQICINNNRKIRGLSEEIIETLTLLKKRISMEYCKLHGVVEHKIVFVCPRCEEGNATKTFNEVEDEGTHKHNDI